VKHSIPLFRRTFYFLRHGETEMNADRLVAGSIDTALTERGREQAAKAAAALAHEPITAIYSSPLQRACDTAAPVGERLRLPVIVIPELAERTWGVLEGQPRGSRMRGTTPEGAEATRAFFERVLSGFAKIDSEVPLIVGHSGVFRVLCRTLGILESAAPVENALPLRFLPPNGGAWTLLPITNTGHDP
jgi:probable phosphoglycerate mutase